MYLIMLVDGKEIARKQFLHSDKLSQLMSDLKKEFEPLIIKTSKKGMDQWL